MNRLMLIILFHKFLDFDLESLFLQLLFFLENLLLIIGNNVLVSKFAAFCLPINKHSLEDRVF